jgi:hypothetical protein
MPTTIERIQGRLLDPQGDLRNAIGKHIGSFTVALFGIFGAGEAETLKLAGSGTLVRVAGMYYVLTAAHVWEWLVKEGAKGLGLTLRPEDDHKFVLRMEIVAAYGPKLVGKWTEWGPDLAFLRIPSELVGPLTAFKTFENLSMQKAGPPNVDSVELRALMGAPAVQGTFTKVHAEININTFFGEQGMETKRGDFDYVDLLEDTSFPGVPATFGGVSGGGLWRVVVYEAEGKCDWHLTFMGTAFYQIPQSGGNWTIRCHGLESIHIVRQSIKPA